VVLLGGGCKKDPSFRLRWDVAGEALTDTTQCSEPGVLHIVAHTFDEFGFLVDTHRYPCFPQSFDDPEATVAGPTLPAGEYAVEVRGVTRNFQPWIDDITLEQEIRTAEIAGKNYLTDFEFRTCLPFADEPRCRPEDISCDCTTVLVEDEVTARLETLDLGVPPQCEDGIDNDRDGLVDGNDPACAGTFSADSREDRNVASSEFDVRVTLLGDNPSAQCSGLGIATLRASIGDTAFAQTSDCGQSLRFLAIVDETLADGPAVDGKLPITVRVDALNAAGEPLAETVELPLSVPEEFGDFFVLQADFSADTFLEPIVAPARLRLAFRTYDGGPDRSCAAPSGAGFLELATMRVEVLDAHGGTISPPIAAGEFTLDGSDLACSAQQLTTAALTWGDYLVRVEGLSADGDVCFSNADNLGRAAPSDPVVIVADRVSSTGSCRDCDSDDDCETLSCTDGICRP
jgi:hypothetical protein